MLAYTKIWQPELYFWHAFYSIYCNTAQLKGQLNHCKADMLLGKVQVWASLFIMTFLQGKYEKEKIWFACIICFNHTYLVSTYVSWSGKHVIKVNCCPLVLVVIGWKAAGSKNIDLWFFLSDKRLCQVWVGVLALMAVGGHILWLFDWWMFFFAISIIR